MVFCISHLREVHKSPARSRLEGYEKALKKYEIPFNDTLVSIGDIDVEDGYERTKQMMEKNLDFAAIFAYNDMMAFGLQRYDGLWGYAGYKGKRFKNTRRYRIGRL